MNKNLLVVGAGEYGIVAKEIAEEMGCFNKIDFLDDKNVEAIGKIEEVENFYPEYMYAIALCEDGEERIELNKKLEESRFVVSNLVHTKSLISPSANLLRGCVVEPGAVIESQTTIGVGCIVGANCVVEHHCFIGDGSLLKAGTIVRANTVLTAGTVTEYGSVLLESLV